MKKLIAIFTFILLACVGVFGYCMYSGFERNLSGRSENMENNKINENLDDEIRENDITIEDVTIVEKWEEQIENVEQIEIEKQKTEEATGNEEKITVEASDLKSHLSIHFIDVGQGDATLVICDEEAMLIDAGDNTKGTTVQFYLKRAGVERLKYLICSHPDADHIGGADVIVTKFNIDTIIMLEESVDSSAFYELMDAVEYRNYRCTYPEVGASYKLGNAEFTILSPTKKYNIENDNSIVIALNHGDNRFILSGDAEEAAELDIIKSGWNIDVDLYKAGHHGSATSSSEIFLKAMSPKSVIISCGKDNIYGHPNSYTIEKIEALGADIYRTDLQGTIVAFSDGKSISFNTESWNKDSIQDTTTVGYTYICNKNTKRFHYPNCKSVNEMRDKNKLFVEATREELIEEGYIPCGNCNP